MSLDIKLAKSSKPSTVRTDKKVRRRRKKRNPLSFPERRVVPSMMYSSKWNAGILGSDTAGAILSSSSTNIATPALLAPTIQNSSEYSQLNVLFGQIRLISYQVIFTPKLQNFASTVHGRLMLGYFMNGNANNIPLVSGYTTVQNTLDNATIESYGVRPFIWTANVPELEFSALNADSPSTITPWAGSPGVIIFYGDDFTASLGNYFSVDVICVWQLRARG